MVRTGTSGALEFDERRFATSISRLSSCIRTCFGISTLPASRTLLSNVLLAGSVETPMGVGAAWRKREKKNAKQTMLHETDAGTKKYELQNGGLLGSLHSLYLGERNQSSYLGERN